MSDKVALLNKLFASVYTLYLNTQSAHWHVKGPEFYSLHMLFEKQYQAIALQIDEIAELIVMSDAQAPAYFQQIVELSVIENFTVTSASQELLAYLIDGNAALVKLLTEMLESNLDENTNTALTDLLAYYEKELWMLRSSK